MDGHGSWSGERDGLVGRDPALALVRELLDEGSRTAVISEIPGAGKTSVLTAASRAAATEGWQVFGLTCHANDQDLAFGALIDLLGAAPGGEDALERVVRRVDAPPSDPLLLRLDVLTMSA